MAGNPLAGLAIVIDWAVAAVGEVNEVEVYIIVAVGLFLKKYNPMVCAVVEACAELCPVIYSIFTSNGNIIWLINVPAGVAPQRVRFDAVPALDNEPLVANQKPTTNGLNEGFEFINPNERDRCGCGESFRV